MALERVRVGVAGIVLALGACQGGYARPSGQVELDPEPADRSNDRPGVQDAAAACDTVEGYVDADGDGLGVGVNGRPVRVSVCDGGALPVGFSLQAGDCDDGDPGAFQRVCVDRDGDGAVTSVCVGAEAPADETSCRVEVPSKPGPRAYDCDDSDAQAIDTVYRDADGDGVGAGDAVCFRAKVGWTAKRGDCDDADASRRPDAFDVFEDDVDSDCDGTDGGPCVDESLTTVEVQRPIACEGLNLALSALTCSICAVEAATLVVQNRGDLRVRAEVQIALRDENDIFRPFEGTFIVDLAAGERKALVSGPFAGRYELRTTTPGTTDCSLDDNFVEVPFGHCL